jgi:serine protease Do
MQAFGANCSVEPLSSPVLMVGRQAVRSAAEFNAALKDVKPGDSVMLLVRRDEAIQFVAVPVPKRKDNG